jgi:biotin synthase-related radical SAM superfamily protein
MTVDKIRVSIGSASVLGLYQNKKFEDPPTTCYIMTYIPGHCTANCGFCPQARDSISPTNLLSRVTWPIFPFKDFLTKLNYMPPPKRFKRICVQSLNYPENFEHLVEIITQIKKNSKIPISLAVPPLSNEKLNKLKLLGIDRVGIALDGASKKIFEDIKGDGVQGPYHWNDHLLHLKEALKIFSEGHVTTHLIVGLGETSADILKLIEDLNNLKILVSLFAFTPIKGTKLENLAQPNLIKFRKIQLGRYLMINDKKTMKDFTFNSKGELIKLNINKKELKNIVEESEAFMTSGCPGCNRTYYTSRPSGPIFNYPRKLYKHEKEEIYNLLQRFVN